MYLRFHYINIQIVFILFLFNYHNFLKIFFS